MSRMESVTQGKRTVDVVAQSVYGTPSTYKVTVFERVDGQIVEQAKGVEVWKNTQYPTSKEWRYRTPGGPATGTERGVSTLSGALYAIGRDVIARTQPKEA